MSASIMSSGVGNCDGCGRCAITGGPLEELRKNMNSKGNKVTVRELLEKRGLSVNDVMTIFKSPDGVCKNIDSRARHFSLRIVEKTLFKWIADCHYDVFDQVLKFLEKDYPGSGDRAVLMEIKSLRNQMVTTGIIKPHEKYDAQFAARSLLLCERVSCVLRLIIDEKKSEKFILKINIPENFICIETFCTKIFQYGMERWATGPINIEDTYYFDKKMSTAQILEAEKKIYKGFPLYCQHLARMKANLNIVDLDEFERVLGASYGTSGYLDDTSHDRLLDSLHNDLRKTLRVYLAALAVVESQRDYIRKENKDPIGRVISKKLKEAPKIKTRMMQYIRKFITKETMATFDLTGSNIDNVVRHIPESSVRDTDYDDVPQMYYTSAAHNGEMHVVELSSQKLNTTLRLEFPGNLSKTTVEVSARSVMEEFEERHDLKNFSDSITQNRRNSFDMKKRAVKEMFTPFMKKMRSEDRYAFDKVMFGFRPYTQPTGALASIAYGSLESYRELHCSIRSDYKRLIRFHDNEKGEKVYTHMNAVLEKQTNMTTYETFVLNDAIDTVIKHLSSSDLTSKAKSYFTVDGQHLEKDTRVGRTIDSMVNDPLESARCCQELGKSIKKSITNLELQTYIKYFLDFLNEESETLAMMSPNNGYITVPIEDAVTVVENGTRKTERVSTNAVELLRETFARANTSEASDHHMRVTLDMLALLGIDFTLPLLRFLFLKFCHTNIPISSMGPRMPLAFYMNNAAVLEVVDLERPKSWKNLHLLSKTDRANAAGAFGLALYGLIKEEKYPPLFFKRPVENSESLKTMREEGLIDDEHMCVVTHKRVKMELTNVHYNRNVVVTEKEVMYEGQVTREPTSAEGSGSSNNSFFAQLDQVNTDTCISVIEKQIERDVGTRAAEYLSSTVPIVPTCDAYSDSDDYDQDMKFAETILKRNKSKIRRAQPESLTKKETENLMRMIYKKGVSASHALGITNSSVLLSSHDVTPVCIRPSIQKEGAVKRKAVKKKDDGKKTEVVATQKSKVIDLHFAVSGGIDIRSTTVDKEKNPVAKKHQERQKKQTEDEIGSDDSNSDSKKLPITTEGKTITVSKMNNNNHEKLQEERRLTEERATTATTECIGATEEVSEEKVLYEEKEPQFSDDNNILKKALDSAGLYDPEGMIFGSEPEEVDVNLYTGTQAHTGFYSPGETTIEASQLTLHAPIIERSHPGPLLPISAPLSQITTHPSSPKFIPEAATAELVKDAEERQRNGVSQRQQESAEDTEKYTFNSPNGISRKTTEAAPLQINVENTQAVALSAVPEGPELDYELEKVLEQQKRELYDRLRKEKDNNLKKKEEKNGSRTRRSQDDERRRRQEKVMRRKQHKSRDENSSEKRSHSDYLLPSKSSGSNLNLLSIQQKEQQELKEDWEDNRKKEEKNGSRTRRSQDDERRRMQEKVMRRKQHKSRDENSSNKRSHSDDGDSSSKRRSQSDGVSPSECLLMANTQAITDIQEGRKLTDDVILPVLEIIKSKTGVEFIDPAVLKAYQSGGRSNLLRASRAILIVHLGMIETDGHWVLTTCENDIVTVYDSLNQIDVCPQLKDTIETVFGKDKKIRAVHVATPQANSNDCGVLACAYAVDWALGADPTDIQYEYGSLRTHLVTILRYDILLPFPKIMQVHDEARKEPTKKMSDRTATTKKQRHLSEYNVGKPEEEEISGQEEEKKKSRNRWSEDNERQKSGEKGKGRRHGENSSSSSSNSKRRSSCESSGNNFGGPSSGETEAHGDKLSTHQLEEQDREKKELEEEKEDNRKEQERKKSRIRDSEEDRRKKRREQDKERILGKNGTLFVNHSLSCKTEAHSDKLNTYPLDERDREDKELKEEKEDNRKEEQEEKKSRIIGSEEDRRKKRQEKDKETKVSENNSSSRKRKSHGNDAPSSKSPRMSFDMALYGHSQSKSKNSDKKISSSGSKLKKKVR